MLAFGAAAIVAAAVILYLATQAGDAPASSAKPGPMVAESEPRPEDPSGNATPPKRERQASKQANGETMPAPREYVTEDGRRVRDHRRNPTPEEGSAPAPDPPARTLSTSTTQTVVVPFKEAIRECTKSLPPRAPGAKRSRLQGELLVEIKEQQLTVTDAKLGIPGMEGEAVTAAIACLKEKSAAIATSATGEADFQSTSIRIDVALP
jgi:hypothetical protein